VWGWVVWDQGEDKVKKKKGLPEKGSLTEMFVSPNSEAKRTKKSS